MSNSNQTLTVTNNLQSSSISIDPSRTIASLDNKIYSGFIEHLGRCIYGGIIDYSYKPKTQVTSKGYRLDVSNAIKDLEMPVVRWPGGNFVSSYHWIDGVGPKEQRPRRPELAWLGEESNLFGTDEFMEWCDYMKVEPYLCLNMGTGTLDEALAWIEYCNSTGNTHYANLRRKNGHPEPYNVKYWGLGNEVWGPWQVGQMTAEDYVKKAKEWAKAIKLLDPNVKLISCGCTGVDNWDHEVLDGLINWIDLHSIHIYTANDNYLKNVTGPIAAETAIQVTKNLIELAHIQHPPRSTAVNSTAVSVAAPEKVKICFDEWNVWDPTRADGIEGAEEQYTISDALAVASWLNVFVRQCDSLGMCNIAQLVNVIAPIMTNEKSMFLQTTYWPLKLFSNYMKNGKSLNLHVEAPIYKGPTGNNDGQFTWLQRLNKIPLLDVSAIVRDDCDKIYLSVVNKDETEDSKTKIKLSNINIKEIKQWRLQGDLDEFNSFEDPDNVKLEERVLKVSVYKESFELNFPKHSFTFLEISY